MVAPTPVRLVTTQNANCSFGHVLSVVTLRCLSSTRAYQANVELHIHTTPNAAPQQDDALNAPAQKLAKLKDFISPQVDYQDLILDQALQEKPKP